MKDRDKFELPKEIVDSLKLNTWYKITGNYESGMSKVEWEVKEID